MTSNLATPFRFAQEREPTVCSPSRPRVLASRFHDSRVNMLGALTQYERHMALPINTPCVSRRSFPAPNYWSRGAPKRNEAKITTFGYKLSLVPAYSNATVGLGGRQLEQLPRPRTTHVRTRHDACLIRPSRSLSVKQIIAGEYFARPDPAAYERLLREAHMSPQERAQLRAERIRAARALKASATLPRLTDSLQSERPATGVSLAASASAPVLSRPPTAALPTLDGGALWKEI